jgi:hypothetical protein
MIPPISFAVAHGHETGRRLRAALHRTHAFRAAPDCTPCATETREGAFQGAALFAFLFSATGAGLDLTCRKPARRTHQSEVSFGHERHDTNTSLGASKTWTLIDRIEDVHFEEESS